MPAAQLMVKPPFADAIAETIGGAAVTRMFIVAVLVRPPGSATLTTKLLVPTLAERGMPDSEPSEPTDSQLGPLTKAKVSASLVFGSLAFVAIVPDSFCPATMEGRLKGLTLNEGAPFT